MPLPEMPRGREPVLSWRSAGATSARARRALREPSPAQFRAGPDPVPEITPGFRRGHQQQRGGGGQGTGTDYGDPVARSPPLVHRKSVAIRPARTRSARTPRSTLADSQRGSVVRGPERARLDV
jgi:hypothetical protein